MEKLRRWALWMLSGCGALIWGLGVLFLIYPLSFLPASLVSEAFNCGGSGGGVPSFDEVLQLLAYGAGGIGGQLLGGAMRLWVALLGGRKVISEDLAKPILINEGLRILFLGVGCSLIGGAVFVSESWSFESGLWPLSILGPFLYMGGGIALISLGVEAGRRSSRLMIGPRFVRTVHGLTIRETGEADTVEGPPLEY